MCGINLIIDKNKKLASQPIKAMAEANRHRGPDHSATFSITSNICNYHIAANQLKISDLTENSAQPFFSNDRRFALLFNGEIYNFYDLKNKLITSGISFTSHSDTEVLFYWLKKHGRSGIEMLEGMFAFAFIDTELHEVMLARDRFGIKPFYFYDNEDYFIASSEVKSILSTQLVKKKLNEAQVNHYLRYKHVQSPETIFKNIFAIEPGKIYQLEIKQWSVSKYTLAENKLSTHSTSVPNIGKVESLITNSLLRQLNAQVPIGLLLSGGVDSTLLLALAQKEGFTLPTYSIVNNKSDAKHGTNDFHYAKLAAEMFQSEHHEVELSPSVLDNFENFVEQLDQPIGDSSQLMTSEVCSFASTSAKVLLSGAGADELFGGYNRHYAFHKYLSNQNLLIKIQPLLLGFINSLPPKGALGLRRRIRLWKKLINSMDRSPALTYHNFLTFNEVAELQDTDLQPTPESWIDWALRYDLENYLVDDVLALSDQASMRHGIELRVPYLDEHLVKYLSGFSTEARLVNGRKWILKRILTKLGGKRFANRAKEGFGLPLAAWMFTKEASHLWEPFESADAIIFQYLEKAKYDQLVHQQTIGSHDHSHLLWSIAVLGHWLEQNFT